MNKSVNGNFDKERSKFESLPQIKGILDGGDFYFSTLSMNYKSNNSDHLHCVYFLNGAWYAWQENVKVQAENTDKLETLNNVEIILERLTFHIFEEVMIWSNEAASSAFTRCVKKTIEEFKNGQLILTKGYPQLKHFQVDNVLNALNSALHQAQEHQDNLNKEIVSLKANTVPIQIINEIQSWIAVKSNQAMELDGEAFVIGANELAEFIEQLVKADSGVMQ